MATGSAAIRDYRHTLSRPAKTRTPISKLYDPASCVALPNGTIPKISARIKPRFFYKNGVFIVLKYKGRYVPRPRVACKTIFGNCGRPESNGQHPLANRGASAIAPRPRKPLAGARRRGGDLDVLPSVDPVDHSTPPLAAIPSRARANVARHFHAPYIKEAETGRGLVWIPRGTRFSGVGKPGGFPRGIFKGFSRGFSRPFGIASKLHKTAAHRARH